MTSALQSVMHKNAKMGSRKTGGNPGFFPFEATIGAATGLFLATLGILWATPMTDAGPGLSAECAAAPSSCAQLVVVK